MTVVSDGSSFYERDKQEVEAGAGAATVSAVDSLQ